MHYLISHAKVLVQGRGSDEDMVETSVNPSGISVTIYKKKKIYSTPPHIFADNHFSDEHVMDFVGEKGFGMTATNRRGRFPKGLKKYFHHGKVVPGCMRSKVMRYEIPIVAVKQVQATPEKRAYIVLSQLHHFSPLVPRILQV